MTKAQTHGAKLLMTHFHPESALYATSLEYLGEASDDGYEPGSDAENEESGVDRLLEVLSACHPKASLGNAAALRKFIHGRSESRPQRTEVDETPTEEDGIVDDAPSL